MKIVWKFSDCLHVFLFFLWFKFLKVVLLWVKMQKPFNCLRPTKSKCFLLSFFYLNQTCELYLRKTVKFRIFNAIPLLYNYITRNPLSTNPTKQTQSTHLSNALCECFWPFRGLALKGIRKNFLFIFRKSIEVFSVK